ncbi:MAG: LysR family transcriptional regulator [Bdellovibrionota bacterium]
MKLNNLQSMLVLEQEKSVGAAARMLGLSQPALSHQIKQMEADLQQKLFVKKGRSLEFTAQGKLMLEYAHKICDLKAELVETFRFVGKKQESRFRIGISEQIQPTVLADMFQEARLKSLPMTQRLFLHVFEETAILARLEQKVIDLALVSKHSDEKTFRNLAHIEMPVGFMLPNSLGTEIIAGLQACCASGDFGGIANIIRHNNLPFVFPTDKYLLKKETTAFFDRIKVAPNVVMESDHLGMLLVAVIYGRGIALQPLATLPVEMRLPEKVTCIQPPQGLWKHSLWLVARREKDEALREKLYLTFAKAIRGWASPNPVA